MLLWLSLFKWEKKKKMHLSNMFNFPILVQIKRLSWLPTLEQATYDCPCEKQSVCKYKPHNSKDCPCALLIMIADANRIGNCNLLNWNDISVGIIGIRGMRTSSPLKGPVKIFASIILVINFFYWKTCAIIKLGLVNIAQHDKISIKQQNK